MIRKVRLRTDGKVAVELRGGTAERGEMVRVDVFREPGSGKRRDRFHLVPIYPNQVSNRVKYPAPPCQAVVAHKPEREWTDVAGRGYPFLFSAWPNSLIEVARSNAKPIVGYFKGMDRQGAQIAIASPISAQAIEKGIGSKTLLSFRKLSVDRLGRKSAVSGETRTWHGEVCT